MATVADLVLLLDDKLLPYRGSYDVRGPNDIPKVRLLNSGKEMVWRTVVAASQESRSNWFSKSATLSYTTGDDTEDLPGDFHSLLGAESVTVEMRPSNFHKQEWRADRAESANLDLTTAERLYYVVGGNATAGPALLISRKPAATLSVAIQYVAHLAEWTSESSNIDDLPEPLRDPVVTWAAQNLLGAAQDSVMAKFWGDLAEADRQSIIGVSKGRQFGGVVTEEDLDSAG